MNEIRGNKGESQLQSITINYNHNHDHDHDFRINYDCISRELCPNIATDLNHFSLFAFCHFPERKNHNQSRSFGFLESSVIAILENSAQMLQQIRIIFRFLLSVILHLISQKGKSKDKGTKDCNHFQR